MMEVQLIIMMIVIFVKAIQENIPSFPLEV